MKNRYPIEMWRNEVKENPSLGKGAMAYHKWVAAKKSERLNVLVEALEHISSCDCNSICCHEIAVKALNHI